MRTHRVFTAAVLATSFFALTGGAPTASGQDRAPAKTVITVLPKQAEQTPAISPEDLRIKVNGKAVQTQSVTPLRGDRAGLELVILIDSGARTSLGRQLSDLANFIRALPPTTEVGIAYMMNGRAVFEQPFTSDKARAVNALHLPAGGPGSSASPYFCLSEMAKNWPSRNAQNRREVIAITDGIDPYEPRFDPSDPYVHMAIQDSIRAGVIVDALYWHNEGRASRIEWLASGGQSLLTLVTEKTGGKLYYQGLGNPVSFAPFLEEISRRLNNQYELGFMVPARSKPQVQSLNVKLQVPGVRLTTPDLVFIPAR
ncbi:MAG TPA: hypothetical protein VFI72_01995 [Candidatus Angelobacter sp.]|nr:hypothetical protein [Candidatus Angelobacter sp.]